MPDGAVLAVLDGVLERVTFANPETGYTIPRIAPERGSGAGAELATAVGPLLGAQVGEFLRLRGRWSSHPKYGRQFWRRCGLCMFLYQRARRPPPPS
jgi:exodeoxyribonuclease V alpha subunit